MGSKRHYKKFYADDYKTQKENFYYWLLCDYMIYGHIHFRSRTVYNDLENYMASLISSFIRSYYLSGVYSNKVF